MGPDWRGYRPPDHSHRGPRLRARCGTQIVPNGNAITIDGGVNNYHQPRAGIVVLTRRTTRATKEAL
jgi:hypothetical protein